MTITLYLLFTEFPLYLSGFTLYLLLCRIYIVFAIYFVSIVFVIYCRIYIVFVIYCRIYTLYLLFTVG